MKTAKLTCFALVFASLPSLAVAHPGHDGHELTWDFAGTHLHLEWLVGALVFAGAVGAVYRFARKRG